MKKQVKQIVAIMLVLLSLTGCLQGEKKTELPLGAAENEILTVTPVDQEKEMVTIHYEYGQINVAQIESTIEEEFPDVDIVMVHDGSADVIGLEQNLSHGTGQDIIFSRDVQQMNDAVPDYFLDLSGEEFVNNYYLTALDACILPDGGLYYLPGPSDIYGVIYNKTMFEENGWEVPHSYSEYVELIHKIENSGLTAVEKFDGEEKEVALRAVQPALFFSDAFQLVINSFAYDKVFGGKENLEWLTAYQKGKGSMVGHMEPYAETLKKLVDDGILRLDDWDFRPRFRSSMMYEYHSTAMIFETQNAYENNLEYGGEEADEIGMLPFWTGDEPGSDYLYAMPSYFMGINKASAQVSSERKQLLLDIVGYLSTPEAQLKMFGSGMQISSVKDVPVGGGNFTKEVQKTVEEGRVISNFYFADGDAGRTVETKLNDTAREMLTGEITVEEWLKGADEARDAYLAGQKKENKVYGTCEEDLTRFEVALMMGEMYRTVTDADIALVYVNKNEQGVNCNMFDGSIDDYVLATITPDRISEEGESVASATMTGQQIMDALAGEKYGDDTIPNWYYVASGLEVEYAPWNKSGERLISCKLPDGSSLDPEAKYKVAFFSDKIPGINNLEKRSEILPDLEIRDKKWKDLFIEYLNSRNGVLTRPKQTTKLVWTVKCKEEK